MSYSDIFRDADYWRGTLFLNEGDPKKKDPNTPETDDIIKYLNERYEKGSFVGRRDRETLRSVKFKAYGPTIITTRSSFPDDATEDRTIVMLMSERLRDDPAKDDFIPLNFPPGFYEEGKLLRRKLWKFYLDNILTFKIDFRMEFKGVGARLNQILQPIASLAKQVDPELYAVVAEIAKELKESSQESRAWSMDGVIVRAYFKCRIDSTATNGTRIRDVIQEAFGWSNVSTKTIANRMKAIRGMHNLRNIAGLTRGRNWRISKSPVNYVEDPETEDRLARRYLPEDELEVYAEWRGQPTLSAGEDDSNGTDRNPYVSQTGSKPGKNNGTDGTDGTDTRERNLGNNKISTLDSTITQFSSPPVEGVESPPGTIIVPPPKRDIVSVPSVPSVPTVGQDEIARAIIAVLEGNELTDTQVWFEVRDRKKLTVEKERVQTVLTKMCVDNVLRWEAGKYLVMGAPRPKAAPDDGADEKYMGYILDALKDGEKTTDEIRAAIKEKLTIEELARINEVLFWMVHQTKIERHSGWGHDSPAHYSIP